MEIYIVLIAVILAASTGFKTTIAMFGYSLAVNTGFIQVSSSMDWIGSPVCLVLLVLAMVVEFVIGFIPYLDHVFDVVLFPVVIIAGTLMVSSSSAFGETEPVVRWALGLILGGGPAAISHLCSAFVRGLSTLSTAGFGNFLVHLVETILAIFLVIIALLIPILALLFLFFVFGAVGVVYLARRKPATA